MDSDDLTDEERAAAITALREKIDKEWRYRLSERMAPYRSALAKLDPASAAKPPPVEKPPLPQAPPRARGGKRVRR